MSKLKLIALLLAAATLFTLLAACSDNGDKPGKDESDSESGESASESDGETKPTYEYEEADYENYTIRVLNVLPLWGAYTAFEAEQTGEGLDEAIYKRNRRVESELNVQFEEIAFEDIWGYYKNLLNSISSDEDAYDIAFVSESSVPTMLSQNCFYNLLDIPELQLEQPWWDQDVKEGLTLNDHLYSITGPINLMAAELTACMWFNYAVCDNYTLDYPYQLVRDGKWTFEQLQYYCKTVAGLNGQSDFTYDPEGAAVYGLNTSWVPMSKFIYGFDMHYFEQDSDGDYRFIANEEKFISRIEDMAEFFSSSSDGRCMYEKDLGQAFQNNRVFAFTNEVKAAVQFREYDTVFGILPYPKWDEAQENYRSTISIGTVEFTIPVTVENVERSATVADMLAYYSYVDVLPEYYNNYLFIKGFRDKSDDVEMLELINSVRGVDTAVALQWIGTFHDWNELPLKIGSGDPGIASLIDSKRDSFISKMENMIEEVYSD